MDVTYEIRQIKDSQSKDLIYLLNLYSDNIAPSIRTSTNEIVYWLDNFHARKGGDIFWILALYLNGKPIGFSQMVYLHHSKILFIDYCVIDPDYRGRAFNEYTYLIRDFFADKNISINHYVTEVAFYNQDNHPSPAAQKLIRLLKMVGFRVIKAIYKQPELGLENHDSEMRATLMIFVNGGEDDSSSIKKETYLDIVHTVFYNHYIPWYKAFMTEKETQIYRKKIDSLFESIKREVNKKEFIPLNGEPYPFEPSKRPPAGHNWTLLGVFVVSLIVAYIGISWLTLWIENTFSISTDTQLNNWRIAGVLTIVVFLIWVIGSKSLREILMGWITNKTKSER